MHVFHKYGKWEIFSKGDVYEPGRENPYAMYFYQKKVCEICGKTKIKKIIK